MCLYSLCIAFTHCVALKSIATLPYNNRKALLADPFPFIRFQFVTSVVSCCPAELKQEVNGKKETLKGFNVLLQDTILFPEGGGQVSAFIIKLVPPLKVCVRVCDAIFLMLSQPDDHGLIGEVPVLRVTRQGPDAVHFVTSPVEVRQEVRLTVDWERRFDHMQQHSGEEEEDQTAVF